MILLRLKADEKLQISRASTEKCCQFYHLSGIMKFIHQYTYSFATATILKCSVVRDWEPIEILENPQ